MENQRSVVVPRALALLACLAGASGFAQSSSQQPSSVNTFYGAFTYTEPIAVPLFRGLEPSLRLAYGSGAGSGLAGVGWGLEGFSTLERAGQSRGTPRYDPAIFTTIGKGIRSPGGTEDLCPPG